MPFINSQGADKLWSVDFAVGLVYYEVNFKLIAIVKIFGGKRGLVGGSEDDFRLVNYSYSLGKPRIWFSLHLNSSFQFQRSAVWQR